MAEHEHTLVYCHDCYMVYCPECRQEWTPKLGKDWFSRYTFGQGRTMTIDPLNPSSNITKTTGPLLPSHLTGKTRCTHGLEV